MTEIASPNHNQLARTPASVADDVSPPVLANHELVNESAILQMQQQLPDFLFEISSCYFSVSQTFYRYPIPNLPLGRSASDNASPPFSKNLGPGTLAHTKDGLANTLSALSSSSVFYFSFSLESRSCPAAHQHQRIRLLIGNIRRTQRTSAESLITSSACELFKSLRSTVNPPCIRTSSKIQPNSTPASIWSV